MRNLKKVLSLALAMVMLLGMMVVGAGAATEFKDADSIKDNRKVAAAVASTIEVLVGDENGNFNPDGTLTRAEAAVVLARLDLGASAASALTATDAATFDDIGAGSGYGWAKPFIDYCYGNGYMVGVGGNSFAPGRTLTGVEFATMVSRVLGYRDENEYGQEGWTAVKAAALARKAGLGSDVAVDSNKMSRADMAQMVLNALTASMVEYTGLNISGDLINVTSPASVRTHTSNTAGYNYTYDGEVIKPNITPIRLCEEKFPTLKLDRSGENDFKEAYSVWKYKGVEISESKVALSYISTTKNEGKSNAWMTNVKRFDPDGCNVYVNGELVATRNDTGISYITGLTGNGRLVEVYVNPDNLSWVEKVVVIDTVPGEVTKVDSEGTLTIKLLETDGVNADKTVDVKKNDLVTAKADVVDGEFKKGDLVLLHAYGKDPIEKGSTVAEVFAPEKREEFVIRKNYDKETQEAVSVDTGSDTGIEEARNVITGEGLEDFSVNNKNKDSVLYLDKYGYIVKIVDWVDTTPEDRLIAIKDVYQDVEGRKIVDRVAGVIANGETIELDYEGDKPTVGTVYVYTDSDSDGKYELNAVQTKAAKTIVVTNSKDGYVSKRFDEETSLTFNSGSTKGHKDTNAGNYFYADSVKFIFANKDGVTVLNGRQNYTGKVTAAAQALNEKNEIIAVFLEAEPDIVSLDDIVFVWTRRSKDEVVGTDKQTVYYGYEAYMSDGNEIPDFFGTKENMVGTNGVGTFYKEDTVKDGDVTAYKPSRSDKVDEHTTVNALITYANGTSGDAFIINGDTNSPKELLTTSRTKVIDLATNGTITTPAELNKTMNKDDKTVRVAVVYTYDKTTDNYEVHTIFVTDVDSDTSFKKETEVIPNAPKQFTVTITPVTGVTIEVTTAGGEVVKTGDKFDENTVLNVKATANDTAKSTTLTVDGEVYDKATLTLTKGVTISATEPTDKPAEAEKALNVVLDKKDTDAGISIKSVHLVSGADVTAGTYTTAEGAAEAGDVAIILDIPTGVTLTTAASGNTKLTGKNANGFTVSAGADAIAPADKIVRVGKAAVATMDKDVTYTLDSVLGAVSKQVKVVDETGLGLDVTTDKTTVAQDTVAGQNELNVTITDGVPKFAKTASVVYTVTGLKSGTLAGTDGTGTDAGMKISAALTATHNASGDSLAKLTISSNAKADPDAANVVITIKEIRVVTQDATFEKATGTLEVTTDTAFDLPQMTVASLGDNSVIASAKAIVSITGARQNTGNTTKPVTNREMALTYSSGWKTTADADTPYISDNKVAVKVTVTPVITALKKEVSNWTLSGSGVGSGGSLVTLADLSGDIVIENGTNKADITLTFTKADKFADDTILKVKGVDGAIFSEISSEQVDNASGESTRTITIPAGALSNITGGEIMLVLNIVTGT